MRNRNLQHWVTTGRFTLPAVTLICITCWVLTGFILPHLVQEPTTYFLDQWIDQMALPEWINQSFSFMLYAIIGYSLIQINNTFGIIRMRASVQTSVFLLLIAVCPALHNLHIGNLAALSLIISLYYLLKSYQQPNPARFLFNSFAFIGLGSIAFPQLTLLTPIWLCGAYGFHSLSLRSICAAVLGWFLPYWFLLTHAYFYDEMWLFYTPFIELATFNPMQSILDLAHWEIGTLIYLFIQFAVSAAHTLVSGYKDKIRTRSYLNFLIGICFTLFVLILLLPNHSYNFLLILLPLVSILIGHLYVLTNNWLANAFFICSLLGLVILFTFNIWMLL